MRRFVAVQLGALLLVGCGGSERSARLPPRPTREPAPAAPARTPSPAATVVDSGAAEGPEPPKLVASPSPPVEPMPHVEIQFPISEQVIAEREIDRYKVRVKVENSKLVPGGVGLQMALDGHPSPVRFATIVRLAELVPEGEVLARGEHTLLVFAVLPDGRSIKPAARASRGPFGFVRFWVGERAATAKPDTTPRLVYNLPRGTLNGEAAADAALLDFFVVGADLGAGEYTVDALLRGPDGRAERTVSLVDWSAQRISGLKSGDYEVELRLKGPEGGSPVSAVARTITVNRDAPVAESTKP